MNKKLIDALKARQVNGEVADATPEEVKAWEDYVEEVGREKAIEYFLDPAAK
jgi:hypothetical protein